MDLPIHDSWKTKALSSIPNNVFGVFLTLERSQPLKTWPYNIHGCIGNWKNTIQTQEELLQELLQVGKLTVFSDERRNYFPSFLSDRKCVFKISWMVFPMIEIANNGTFVSHNKEYVFNNQDFGLIVSNDLANKKATYLPKVFPKNISWDVLSKDLLKKANIDPNYNNIKFYSYETKEMQATFDKILFHDSLILPPFVNFLMRSLHENIPFLVKQEEIQYKEDEKVRNLSTLLFFTKVLLHLKKLTPEKQSMYRKITETEYDTWKKDQTNNKLESAYLLPLVKIYLPKDSDKIKTLCEFMKDNIPQLEPEFERGQILIALIRNCSTDMDFLKNIQQKILVELKSNSVSVFQINWESQFLLALSKLLSKSELQEHSDYLAQQLFDKINEIKEINTIETNVLAVMWEALQNLVHNDGSYEKLLDSKIPLFVEIMKRWQPKTGLFSFLSGESRVDITIHVLNGYLLVKKFK